MQQYPKYGDGFNPVYAARNRRSVCQNARVRPGDRQREAGNGERQRGDGNARAGLFDPFGKPRHRKSDDDNTGGRRKHRGLKPRLRHVAGRQPRHHPRRKAVIGDGRERRGKQAIQPFVNLPQDTPPIISSNFLRPRSTCDFSVPTGTSRICAASSFECPSA